MRRSMASSFFTSDLLFGSSPMDLASRSAGGFFDASSVEDFFFVACSDLDFDETSSRASTAALLTLSISDAISSVEVVRPQALRWWRDVWPLEGMGTCRRMQSPIGMK